MSKPTIYLGGTINGLEPEQVIKRFNEIQSGLEYIGFNVLNPIRGKKITIHKDKFFSYEPNEIVHRDLRDIDNSKYMLAFMPVPSIGTSMEIMYAREYDTPVVVVSDNPAVTEHYWIKSLASKVVPDIESAYIYLSEWYL